MAGEITYSSRYVETLDIKLASLGYFGVSIGGTSTSSTSSTPTGTGYLLDTGDDATGDYTFDTDTFVIDSTNHRVGIGIDEPLSLLHIHQQDYLGYTAGNNQPLYRVSATVGEDSAGGTSTFINGLWVVRKTTNGDDWTATKLHDGIGANTSYLTPGTDTKTWWERDPYGNIQSWGNATTTYMSLISGKLAINAASAIGLLEVQGASATSIIASFGNSNSLSTSYPGAIYFSNLNQINSGYNFNTTFGLDINVHGYLQGDTQPRSVNIFNGKSALIACFYAAGNDKMVGILTSQPSYSLHVNGTGFFADELYTGSDVGTTEFFSGFAGSGWRLSYESGVDTTLTVDNLVVRKTLTAYELDINKINSVNGGIVVSSANGVSMSFVDMGGGEYYFYFDEDGGNKPIQFQTNDYIRAQIWTGRGIASFIGVVDSVTHSSSYGSAYIDVYTISGTPWDVMELVQVGNSTDTDRQSLIYITASDTNNPYIDMLAGVDTESFSGKQKLRIGNLTGITDADFGGALSGYGLYANNIYLKGVILITNPEGIDQTDLTNSAAAGATVGATWGINIDGSNKPADNATVGADWSVNLSNVPSTLTTPSGSGLFLSSSYMGYYADSAWKTYFDNAGNMILGDIAGGNAGLSWNQSSAVLTIKGAITATSGLIGGWSINSAYLAKDTGTDSTSAGMAPTDYPFYAGATYANRATAPFRITPAGSAYLTNATISSSTSGKRIVISNNKLYSYTTASDSYYTKIDEDIVSTGQPGIEIKSSSGISTLTSNILQLGISSGGSTAIIDCSTSVLSIQLVSIPQVSSIGGAWRTLQWNDVYKIVAWT